MHPRGETAVTTSEVFDSYEEDFKRLRRVVQDEAGVATSRHGSAFSRSHAARKAIDAQQEASKALQQMELEAKSMGRLGTAISERLRGYRSDLGTMKSQARDADETVRREGKDLDKTSHSSGDCEEGHTRGRPHAMTRRLEETRNSAMEAESIGMSVMGDLYSQRETILRTKGHLNEADEHLDISKRLLNSLRFRGQTQQALLVSIAGILSVAVVVVIFLKIQKILAFFSL
mmetsp:Transcript_42036/g.94517  ORF Transcript_42036/g.94517 Transcript_42036/m.94517 type:complete len:231 (-) Transcript_42036:35-727(-)